MSININLVSDKPEFNNFFSEQIVLPSNAEATMVKANIDISVLQMVGVKVPFIAIGNRGITCLYIKIDGITVNISWTDLYNAHTALAATDIDAGVTATEYFSGEYQYIPNNVAILTKVITVTDYAKLQFADVLAQAIEAEMSFYNVSANPLLKQTDKFVVQKLSLNDQIITRNFNTSVALLENTLLSGYNLNIIYTPQKLLDNALLIKNIDAASLIGWTQSLAAVENVGGTVCQAWFNDNGIDPNGGWYEFRATTLVGGRMATGFVFEGTGLGAAGDNYQPTAVYEPEVIDVGIEFETDAAGVGLYRIIHGHEQYVYYDNTLLKEVVTTKPIYEPANAKHIFQDTDNFYLQIQRGNLYNGSNEFVVNIYQGQTGTGITDTNVRKIFTSSHNLRSPAIIPNIGFMDNGTLGDKFEAIKYIARTTQSDEQEEWRIANIPSGSMIGTFEIDIAIVGFGAVQTVTERNFWSAMMAYTNDIQIDNDNPILFTTSADQAMTCEFKTNFTDENSIRRYYLGEVFLSDVLVQGATTNTLIINEGSTKTLKNLPKEFKVAINNLPVKSYQGSFVTGLTNGIIGSTSGGQARVVGTIPLPQIDATTTNIAINYEPYNLTYKPLNNPEPFMFNQLLMEIFFQDYDTNQRKKFDSVNGHLTLDLNIRQGAKPPPVVNNLRAI